MKFKTAIPVLLILLTGFRLQAQQVPFEPTLTEALLTVKVTDLKDKPRVGEKVSFIDTQNSNEYSGITASDGTFLLLVPKGKKYKVKYKTYSEELQYTEFIMPLAKDTLLSFEFQLKYDLPQTFTLDNVYFETGKATLSPKSNQELDKFADYLKQKKSLVVEIAGHTDNVGDKKANQILSEDRAKSVREYLIKKGIAPERMTTKGYGDTNPIADNASEAGRQKNRRTEIRILKE
jgi:OmpA-OmpF porin, OOP family